MQSLFVAIGTMKLARGIKAHPKSRCIWQLHAPVMWHRLIEQKR